MKQQFAIAAALVVALAGAGCAQNKPAENADTQKPAAEQSADTGTSIKWTEVKTAVEAAKGAGFAKFGVLDEFDIGDLEFANPKFAYAGGVAQATYETPATEVYVRKAVDEYTTPLSDRQLDEFSDRWHKVLEGVDVTCYGKARGAATVATWTDGDTSYAMTFQGLGGEEMSMTDEEVATIVKGFNEANATQTQQDDDAEETKTEAKSTQTTREGASSLISEEAAEAMAEKDCGGESVAIDRVVTKAYGECYYVVCVDEDGTRYEYYVTNSAANLISKTEGQQQEQAKKSESGDGQQSSNASSSTNRKSSAKDDRNSTHYEGQPTTICGSIYAEWHQTSDGTWAATFSTYNGTTIYATPVPGSNTGWFFHVNDGGQSVEVTYTEKDAQKGPAGEISHWKETNGNRWY